MVDNKNIISKEDFTSYIDSISDIECSIDLDNPMELLSFGATLSNINAHITHKVALYLMRKAYSKAELYKLNKSIRFKNKLVNDEKVLKKKI